MAEREVVTTQLDWLEHELEHQKSGSSVGNSPPQKRPSRRPSFVCEVPGRGGGGG